MRGFNMVQLLVLVLFAAAGNPAAVPAAALNSQLQQQVQADTTLSTTADAVKGSSKSHITPEYVASASTWRQQAPSAAAAPGFAGQPPQADAARGQGSHVAANSTPQQQIQDPGADKKRSVKPLWPLDGIDFALLGIIMFSLSLAGGAGIGGGAILVPVYLMLRGWPTAIAVALSNVTILGGSFANFICNVTRHRPNGKRTIDWELILMMEPTTIAGALVGAVANKLLPNWFITYLLAILLTLMALRLYSKGKQTYAKETQLLLAAKAAAKERRKSLMRSDTSAVYARSATITSPEPGPADGPSSLSATSGGVAVPVGSRSMRRSGSYNNALSRSFSRLRGSLVVGFEPGTSLTSPPGVAPVTPSGRSLISPAGRYSLITRVEGEGEDVVGNSAGQDQQQLPGAAVEQYIASTLFQGDVGDGYEPVVALPASDDLSHASSDVSDHVDLEEGGHAAEQTEDQLLQPLLSDDGPSADDLQQLDQRPARAAATDATATDKSWRDVQARQDSSDLTVQLGPIIETAPKEPIPETSLPLPHFLTLLGLSAWVVAADIAQDSFRCGSWQYWASQVSVLIPVVVILAVCRQILLRKYNHDSLPEGSQLQEGELHWTRRTTILYPLLCSSAGLIAGLFGIGGGVVKGPLMLELGVPADVAAATSATMIMFTAGSACLVYSRFGQILYDYAVVLVLLGFTITLCSQLLTFLLIKLLGRRSVIVFMMVALMGAATGIMYVQSGLVTADLVRHPEDLWKFGSICPADRQANLLVQLGHAVMARLQ